MQLPPRLESLVVKTGLHLGVLCGPDRDLVLALAACGVEPGESEPNRGRVVSRG